MALEPARHSFTIWKGATFRKTLTLRQGDTGSDPQDLTGYSAAMPILDAPEGLTLMSLTTTNGGIVLGGALGTIQLVISATVTAAITWESGVYELLITAPASDTDALLYGGMKVKGIR